MPPHMSDEIKTVLINRIRRLAQAQRAVIPAPDVIRVFAGNTVHAFTHGQALGNQPKGEEIEIEFKL